MLNTENSVRTELKNTSLVAHAEKRCEKGNRMWSESEATLLCFLVNKKKNEIETK